MSGNLKNLRFALVAATLTMSANGFAQTVIKGTVTDNTGEPVIGASVLEQGTSSNGGVTDIDGNFTITLKGNSKKLKVSYVGMKPQVVNVSGKSVINIKLEDDATSLNDVVVIGYGSVKKKDLTGSVATVNSETLAAVPVANASEALTGKMPGVQITTSEGSPDATVKIRVRGGGSITQSNDPLFVVDGFPVDDISNIPANEIEDITVLKDASSTAIYGSRGANGVILVTTKKGKEGKVTLNYAGTVTFSTLHDVTKMMNATQWLDYARRAAYNYGAYGDPNEEFAPDYASDQKLFGGEPASWANIEQAWVNGTYHPELVGSYDWASQGKQTGVTHEHTLSASGGTDKFKGYGSFGYLNQKGTQPGQSYQRFTLNTSFEARPVAPLTLGFTMNASYGTQNYG